MSRAWVCALAAAALLALTSAGQAAPKGRKTAVKPATSRSGRVTRPAVKARPKPKPRKADGVALGDKAPNFTLPTPGGEQVSLADTLKNNKGALLVWWSCG